MGLEPAAGRAAPMDRARARARPGSVADRRSHPRPVDRRPAADYRTRMSSAGAAAVAVVAAAVVAAAAGRRGRRPGEIPGQGPTGFGVSPCCPCTRRMACQYLQVEGKRALNNETWLYACYRSSWMFLVRDVGKRHRFYWVLEFN